MEWRQFHCPYCDNEWFSPQKHDELIVTCPECNRSFDTSVLKEHSLSQKLREQEAERKQKELKGQEYLQERRRYWERKKADPNYEDPDCKEKKKSPWDGAFWEVTGEILFGVMVLVLIVPIAILYVGCLAFGGGKR